ncbi:MAG: cupin domain-containing protein [Nitrospinaceae bacterium]|nr:cupin domain-containing protein [Nitrospinaceae bacterium]MBT3822503.1 cupin domain-containing protein [Nitrospinaceae bacterium]MBT4093150.1 cupin domain-containing protein [Nitrospinaceae bacterium]MBT4430973.1 cupin domain-containing protein [Nitrospinaceae bacterium]MBT5369417.1 cupin domain-containing protein [Nitrospinaceae bacterium]
MTEGLIPIRRVVTGNDESGKSKVVWDGPAPDTHPAPIPGKGHTDLWTWWETPPPLSGERDDGDLPYDFPGSAAGGHLRVIQARNRPDDYDPAKDTEGIPFHEPKDMPSRRRWDRGGDNSFSSGMHKTETVDYGIMLTGERELILDDHTLVMKPGDIVVQVGAWHQWASPRLGCQMAFDMIAARFTDGPVGLAQGNDKIVEPDLKLPDGVKPARRIVTIDKEPGKSTLLADGPAPDVRFDPARPGFASARLWVTDSDPATIVMETLHLPHTIEPPKNGTVCRVVTFPPDDVWKDNVGAAEVEAYFSAMGSPGASTYSDSAPHPYMQKTQTLEFCFIHEGEIVLVLDTEEVSLKAGDVVILRGSNHAWSNRSGSPAVMTISSHDGK